MVFPFGLFPGFGRDGARPSTIESVSSMSQSNFFERWRAMLRHGQPEKQSKGKTMGALAAPTLISLIPAAEAVIVAPS